MYESRKQKVLDSKYWSSRDEDAWGRINHSKNFADLSKEDAELFLDIERFNKSVPPSAMNSTPDAEVG